MEGDRGVGKNVTNGSSVKGEEKRTKNRSLGDTSGKSRRVRAVVSDGDVLRAISEV